MLRWASITCVLALGCAVGETGDGGGYSFGGGSATAATGAPHDDDDEAGESSSSSEGGAPPEESSTGDADTLEPGQTPFSARVVSYSFVIRSRVMKGMHDSGRR